MTFFFWPGRVLRLSKKTTAWLSIYFLLVHHLYKFIFPSLSAAYLALHTLTSSVCYIHSALLSLALQQTDFIHWRVTEEPWLQCTECPRIPLRPFSRSCVMSSIVQSGKLILEKLFPLEHAAWLQWLSGNLSLRPWTTGANKSGRLWGFIKCSSLNNAAKTKECRYPQL